MDARPRQLLIAFLSTEIACKLRKLRPTQTRGLLDEFYSPPPLYHPLKSHRASHEQSTAQLSQRAAQQGILQRSEVDIGTGETCCKLGRPRWPRGSRHVWGTSVRSRVRSPAAVTLCAARSFGWQMRIEGPTWSPFEATFLAPFLMILFIFLPIALMVSPAQFQGARAGRELCAQCKRELFFEGHRAHNCSKSQQTKKKKGERKCHDCAQGLGASATGQSRISDIFGASAQNTGNTNALVAAASPSSASFSVSNASAAAVAPNSTPTLEPTPFQSAADVSVATRTFMETSRANQTLHEAQAHAPHDHVVAKFEEWRARGGMTLDLNTNSSSQRVGGKTILRSVGTRVPVEFRQHFQANIMGKYVELRDGMQWERDGYRRTR